MINRRRTAFDPSRPYHCRLPDPESGRSHHDREGSSAHIPGINADHKFSGKPTFLKRILVKRLCDITGMKITYWLVIGLTDAVGIQNGNAW